MELTFQILKYILTAIVILTLYKNLYTVIGFFCRARKFEETDRQHTYGIVICARNEEKVIGNLIDSIRAQNYPQAKLTVFVVADNCDDNTALIAKEKGAVVFERHDLTKCRKGYALGFGFERIREEYGIESFDGYMIFDADNLLHPDYVKEMNKAFDTGEYAVVTGYRNTKNFSSNFISGGYGIHFYFSTLGYHRPRQRLHTSTHVAGTGYTIRSEWLKDGWKWFCLTEDTQFTYHVVANGGTIGYCEAAEFFDEQPTRVGTVLNQRLRWAKGRLYAFFAYAPKMIAGLFKKKTHKWACYDMFFYAFPYGLASALVSIASAIASVVVLLVAGDKAAAGAEVLSLLKGYGMSVLGFWFGNVCIGAIIVIRERKNIVCGKGKQVLYVLLYPWFDLVDVPISLVSLFMHVTWRKIKHDDTTQIGDLMTKREELGAPRGKEEPSESAPQEEETSEK